MINGCPNKTCIYFLKNDSVVKDGFYRRADDSRILQRYRCKCCGKKFSAATFSLERNQKKRRNNFLILKLLTSGVSMRRCALLLKYHHTTIKHKLDYLSAFASLEHKKILSSIHQKVEHFQFDDLITIEHTKLKPLTISVAVNAANRMILGAKVGRIPAFGLLAAKSRKKYGKRKNEHCKTLKRLFAEIKNVISPTALIQSDEHKNYKPIIQNFFSTSLYKQYKSERACVVGQGELKKNSNDPIFVINHTNAMLRANINRLFRRSWCTTKDPTMLEKHLNIYIYFHNKILLSK